LLLPQGINGARLHFVRKRTFSYRKWSLAPFIPKASLSSPPESNHARSAFLTVFHHTAIAKQGTRHSRAASISERRELRSRRKERMENGVKNLMEARLFPKTLSNHGIGEDYHSFFHL
jgi:hypothetical protein